jgi:hypothetical protein
MSDTKTPQIKQQCFADLEALHRQLREMAAKTERLHAAQRRQQQHSHRAVLVIRGK